LKTIDMVDVAHFLANCAVSVEENRAP